MDSWNWVVIIGIVLGFLGFWRLWKSDGPTTRRGLQLRMQRHAQRAVQLAATEYKRHLDFDCRTLDDLLIILDFLHRRHLEKAWTDDELQQHILTWGSYLGLLLQKKYGGYWTTDSILAGSKTYPLQTTRGEALPIIWCLRRIRRGPSFDWMATIHALEAE